MAVKQLTINGTSWMEFRDTLMARKRFQTYGNLFGIDDCHYTAGRLPEPWYSEYNTRREFIDYTVVSYFTPIAWHDTEKGWIMPDVKYSTTTSKAQGKIATAIAQMEA